MALVGCPGTEPISHEPLSQAIVGVDFVDDGQVAYTLLEDLDDIVSASMRWMKMLSWTSISNRTEWKIGMQRWPNLEL